MYVEQIEINRSEAMQKAAVITFHTTTETNCAFYRDWDCGDLVLLT